MACNSSRPNRVGSAVESKSGDTTPFPVPASAAENASEDERAFPPLSWDDGDDAGAGGELERCRISTHFRMAWSAAGMDVAFAATASRAPCARNSWKAMVLGGRGQEGGGGGRDGGSCQT